MRRKLIQRDAFEQIANSSTSAVQQELTEAQAILAKALGKDHLSLLSFNESTVLYKTLDDTYVHSGYEVKDKKVLFNGIEELVIDEESQRAKRRSIIGEMIDSIMGKKVEKADESFSDYMKVFSWSEAKENFFGKKKAKKNPFAKSDDDGCDDKPMKDKSKFNFFKKKAKDAGPKVEEAYVTAQNVLDYCEYMSVGPALSMSQVNRDNSGNVVDLLVPTTKLRNENRLLTTEWNTLRDKVRNSRKEAFALCDDQNFCKAMVELKQQNNVVNGEALQNTLENVVRHWPSMLYLTQEELAKVVAEAFEVVGVNKYDDQMCRNMAEALLVTSHGTYTDRVAQIMHIANAPKLQEGTDAYKHFVDVTEGFYASVDEKFGLERKVFEDLYETLSGIYRSADRRADESVKRTTAGYLNCLAGILNEEAKADLEVAEEVAGWLKLYIETGLEGGAWNVSNSTHVTVSGEHPDMAQKAKVDGIPAKYPGNWGDEAPQIGGDDMNYTSGKYAKEARSKSWGNEAAGSKEVFPGLQNPYQPKPFGDYTMKGDSGVDKTAKGQHHGTWTSDDTFPNLQNPYMPKSETPQSYKMKSDDLVVDK
jgi:hypothetical protein